MNSLTLELLDGCSARRINGIASLVAEDASGQFGIQPRHEAMVTVLSPGLLRYRCNSGAWQYLACAGGPLVCRGNVVNIVSARFVTAEHEGELTAQLDRMRSTEHELRALDREAQAELERALMKRLREWSEARRP
ncbi:F0F1 ATP synthase subunit epsilon [Ralstonia chuxiongensis]|uniref:F0F1 ATP synthase subunit epsilon n=1 Tax=Ralstonia chuxiongensis TaxID=2957504 RepID=UPI0028F56E36|nr:F0F1 ATP synthase subunit epsilon [Ralstonia chuxiongensis]CAJ0780254.1 ATP synthase epsilon chain [Ralstonia chuxiongensis]